MPKGQRRRHLKLPAANLAPAKPLPAEVSITFDDREDTDEFQRLSPAAQAEMRAAWAAQDARVTRRQGFAKTSRTRSMLQAAGVFLFTETCVGIPTWPHTMAAVIVGAGVGAWWHRIGAGRMQCMTTSIVPYVALRLAFVEARSSWGLALCCIAAVVGFVALLATTALVGLSRESRAADDLDY